LQQLPPELNLQCCGQDFIQLSVCKNGERYIVLIDESRGPAVESESVSPVKNHIDISK
jgi:hypothetical protein